MKHRAIDTHLRAKLLHAILIVALALIAGAFSHTAAAAKNEFPAVSPEGLKLVPKTKVSAVYMREGADFSGYDKVLILDCFVAFAKNWQRDINNQTVGTSRKISDSDMTRIKAELAQEFKSVFSKELTEKGQTVVSAEGTNVLILRPAIVNLYVSAPDTMTAGRSKTFAESAGQATLFLELYDGVTSELLARVFDVEVAGDDSVITIRNGVTNRADAQRMLASWANRLGTFLEQARATAKASATPAK